jgi:hypothetical protein
MFSNMFHCQKTYKATMTQSKKKAIKYLNEVNFVGWTQIKTILWVSCFFADVNESPFILWTIVDVGKVYMCEARPSGWFKLELLGSKALKNWPKYKHCLLACQVYHKSKRVMLSSKDNLGGFNE